MKKKKTVNIYLSGVSPTVNKALTKKAKETGLPRKLIVEKILEDVLGIKKNFDARKWLNNF